MDRLTELLTDLEKEFSQGNRQERELSRADIDTSDLIKNDAALLTGLGTAATLPYTGPNWLANFVTRGDDVVRAVSKMYRTANKNMMKPPAPPKKEPLLPTLKKYIEDQKLADQKMMFQQKQIRNNIRNEPPLGATTKNPMEELAAKRILEQQTNRRNFLRQNVMKDQSLIKANEAPSPEYFKNMAELRKLEDLLK